MDSVGQLKAIHCLLCKSSKHATCLSEKGKLSRQGQSGKTGTKADTLRLGSTLGSLANDRGKKAGVYAGEIIKEWGRGVLMGEGIG